MLFFELSKFLGLDCIPMARDLADTGRSAGISIGASRGTPAPNWTTFPRRAGGHVPPGCGSLWPGNGFKLARETGGNRVPNRAPNGLGLEGGCLPFSRQDPIRPSHGLVIFLRPEYDAASAAITFRKWPYIYEYHCVGEFSMPSGLPWNE